MGGKEKEKGREERGREEGEKHQFVEPLYLFIHWLILTCVLTGD